MATVGAVDTGDQTRATVAAVAAAASGGVSADRGVVPVGRVSGAARTALPGGARRTELSKVGRVAAELRHVLCLRDVDGADLLDRRHLLALHASHCHARHRDRSDNQQNRHHNQQFHQTESAAGAIAETH